MKAFINPLSLFLLLSLLFTACLDDDEDQTRDVLNLTFKAQINGDDLDFDTEYSVTNDLRMSVSRLNFYITDPTFTGADGQMEIIEGSFLLDLKSPQSLPFEVPNAVYSSFRFGLGVDAATNAIDANSYPADDPLSSSQQMYWGWSDLYKFFVIEGKVDDQEIGTPLWNQSFAYHTGFDELYTSVEVNKEIWVFEGDDNSAEITLNINKMFFDGAQPFDIVNESSSHSLTEIAERLTENISRAFE